MTDDELRTIRERCEAAIIQRDVTMPRFDAIYLPHEIDHQRAKWAEVYGFALADNVMCLLAEISRLRADAELGRLVRGELYGLWINSGKIATLAVMDGNWFCSTEDDLGPGYDTPEDALRAAKVRLGD